MIIDSPIISGSQSATGPLNQNGNVQITGSLTVTGTINGTITGSITSASYASYADTANSASYAENANTTSASLAAYSASVSTRLTTDETIISTLTSASSSFAAESASLSTRVTNVEVTASVNTQASASFAAQSASLSTRLTTDETNITTLTNASSSFAAQSASLSTRLTQDETNYTNLSSSFASTSGSAASRLNVIETSYATTGSNNFTGTQYISNTSNPQTFTTTASLYTDGGLRVSKDSFISGTAYFNNVVIYGTSSIQYITSSQINVGANIINLNTQLPAQRFGGMAVADSGSNGATGSLLWDSVNNGWIYTRESGSTYRGGALISGPRNTGSIGNEQGTTACYLMMGQGGDHITSSAIYTDDNATCFYGGNAYISSSGTACFANCVSTNQFNATSKYVWGTATNGTTGQIATDNTNNYFDYLGNLSFRGAAASNTLITFASAGAACFAGQVCSNTIATTGNATIGGTISGTTLYASTAVCTSLLTIFCCTGDTRCLQNYVGAGATYNSAAADTVNKIVAGTSYNWYSECWQMGATRGSSTDIASFVIGRNGTTLAVIGIGGVACFASQVCATGFTSTVNVTSPVFCVGAYNFLSRTPSGEMGVLGHNAVACQTASNTIVQVNNSYYAAFIRQYYNEGITFYTRANAGSAGDVLYGAGAVADGGTRLFISPAGIACFACGICAPSLITGGNIYAGTTCTLGTITTKSPSSGAIGLGLIGRASDDYNLITMRNSANNSTLLELGGNASEMYISTVAATPFVTYTSSNARVRITSTGIACFACQVCAPSVILSGNICSNNIRNFGLTLQGLSTPVSTGLPINAYGGGRTYLLLTSQQWDAGNSTSSAITMIRNGYNGDNFTACVLMSSNLQAETWSQSGGILYVTGNTNFQLNITVLNNN